MVIINKLNDLKVFQDANLRPEVRNLFTKFDADKCGFKKENRMDFPGPSDLSLHPEA